MLIERAEMKPRGGRFGIVQFREDLSAAIRYVRVRVEQRAVRIDDASRAFIVSACEEAFELGERRAPGRGRETRTLGSLTCPEQKSLRGDVDQARDNDRKILCPAWDIVRRNQPGEERRVRADDKREAKDQSRPQPAEDDKPPAGNKQVEPRGQSVRRSGRRAYRHGHVGYPRTVREGRRSGSRVIISRARSSLVSGDSRSARRVSGCAGSGSVRMDRTDKKRPRRWTRSPSARPVLHFQCGSADEADPRGLPAADHR